jgi:agmatine deiminase
MIPGTETNKVYLSDLLPQEYVGFCKKLTAILDKYAIPYDFLKGTADIWCRDYMPIQVSEDKLVQFRYDPSYITGENRPKRLTVPEKVCKVNGIKPIFSDINLDGGNVVSYRDRVIISDRIYKENPKHPGDRDALVSDIKELLDAEEVIVIEAFSEDDDMTGHADGMVRFVDKGTVVGNERTDDVEKRNSELLKEKGIGYKDIPFFEYPDEKYKDNAIGIYVNYLEVSNLIILPKYEVEGNRDAEALDMFREIFPDRTVEQLNCCDIARYGGVLNCITWTVLSR